MLQRHLPLDAESVALVAAARRCVCVCVVFVSVSVSVSVFASLPLSLSLPLCVRPSGCLSVFSLSFLTLKNVIGKQICGCRERRARSDQAS